MSFFTCYKYSTDFNSRKFKRPFKPNACFSNLFCDRLDGNTKVVVSIPISYVDSEYEINTTGILTMYKAYLAILKRTFGGIHSVVIKDVRYDHYSVDEDPIKSVVITIYSDNIKIDDKRYGLKWLLTSIRYLYETPYVKFLKKAYKLYLSNKKDMPKLKLLTLLMACHYGESYGHGHTIVTPNYDKNSTGRWMYMFGLKDFKVSAINDKEDMYISDTWKDMPNITNKKLLKLLNDEGIVKDQNIRSW